MTLQEIKKQAEEMLQIAENTERYRGQVEELENEIEQLEEEVADELDFEKDMKLQDKKDRLPTFQKRLKEAEKKEKEELKKRAMHLNNDVIVHQKKAMADVAEVDEAYEEAKSVLKEAYEAIEAYEQARERKALAIVEGVTATGYDKAIALTGAPRKNSKYDILRGTPSKIRMNSIQGMGNYTKREISEEK